METEVHVNQRSVTALLMFDGFCNMCGRIARFIMRRDKHQKFIFITLQSGRAKEILRMNGLNALDMGSFVLVQDGRARLKSDAILGVLEEMGGWLDWMRVFRLVPGPFRDWVYDLMARNRYRLFGKSNQCMRPNPEFKDRFPE